MKDHLPPLKRSAVAVIVAALCALPTAVLADEREDLEKLRATVLSLIDTLIRSGVLPRDRADAMMRDAEKRANVQLAQAPAPEVGADGKKIVRVPYVPEAVRTQMREEIKAEVLAQTRAEGGSLTKLTDTNSKLHLEGDFRLRAEAIRPGNNNTAATVVSQGVSDLTRAPDIWANRNANTQRGQERTRARARLGLDFEVADNVTTGLMLTTGSTTGPTSTNQTMAQGTSQTPGYFNKYGLVLDRAYLKYEPLSWVTLSGGRFRNPFLATDLVWADDLNFEGFAVSAKAFQTPEFEPFVTAGWFPLSFSVANQTRARSLMAAQGGLQWNLDQRKNNIKLGVALYSYSGIEGVKETTTDPSTQPDYVLRSEYGSGYRQRGNTLFRINSSPTFDSATNWGLASGFRELDITAVADFSVYDLLHVVATLDVVRNLRFSRDAMQVRTGSVITDGSGTGFLAKVQVGATRIAKRNDWNASIAYRRLGSDAVVDAFTNSDFGQGGTNNKGFTLAGAYGIAKNTWLSGRWMSSDVINSLVPSTATGSVKTKYAIDTIQFELNARY